jgi:UDP-N-acetylglucosamine--N-acetylmuramyl-(pentapeptide) pyrophosphoryl-undecaprenol N-acetylglucosamine transferase
MNKIIFFVAGGTGGHLFPAIAVAKSFEKSQSHFLIDKRTEKILLGKDFKYHVISSSKLEKNIFTIIISIFKIFYGFVYSFCLIIKFKPSLVVGFGGYTSIPTILAAKVLNKKILIHEQNSVMGKTNRFLSKISTKIAITYKNTIFANESAIFSGIPIRKLKVKNQKKKKNKKVILIIGGSQGAQVFSEIIKKVLLRFDKNLLQKIFIVHQVRKEDLKSMENFYQNLNIKFKIKSFFTNIYDEINNSDLIISRCGASTLAEIEFFKKFCILIPLPTSANNHQFYNAVEFKKTNNCEIINQSNINNDKLVKIIKSNLFEKKIKKIQQQRKTKKLSLVNIINDMLK